jgi:hypothetical protein
MGDWADEKARERLEGLGGRLEGPGPIGEAYGWLEVSDENAASLAALLREVEGDALARGAADGHDLGKEDTLAEVRRVVEEVLAADRHQLLLTSILSRLEKL